MRSHNSSLCSDFSVRLCQTASVNFRAKALKQLPSHGVPRTSVVAGGPSAVEGALVAVDHLRQLVVKYAELGVPAEAGSRMERRGSA